MSELTDRAKGLLDEGLGKAKQAIGEALDKPGLVAEGAIQEAKGEAEKAAANVKGALKD